MARSPAWSRPAVPGDQRLDQREAAAGQPPGGRHLATLPLRAEAELDADAGIVRVEPAVR